MTAGRWQMACVLSALLAGSAAWADRAEDEALALVKKHGGSIERDEEAPNKPVIGVNLKHKSITDPELKKLVAFQHLREVDLFGTKVTGAGLKGLAPLKSLDTIHLTQPSTTDEVLRGLRQAGLLHALWSIRADMGRPRSPDQVTDVGLDHTRVTDAGLENLAVFKNLTVLHLSCCRKVRGTGLKSLAGLKKLIHLNLIESGADDEGMKHVAAIKSLESLNLWNTKVTDAGLVHLASLPALETLHLNGCSRVGDVGMKSLAASKCLRYLILHDTAVSDAGLQHLDAIKRLETVGLIRTKVTAAGLTELKKARPMLNIHDRPDPK